MQRLPPPPVSRPPKPPPAKVPPLPRSIFAPPPPPTAQDKRVARAFVAPPKENLAKYGFQTAGQVSLAKTRMQRDNEISRFAQQIVTTNRLTPKDLALAQRRNRADPTYQKDLQAEVTARTNLALAKIQGSPSGIFGNAVVSTVNPAAWATAGYQGVQGIRHGHYLSGAVDLASVVPLLKPLRGVRAVMEGLRVASEGERAAAVARAAMQSWREGKGIILPSVRAAAQISRRAHLKLPERVALMDAVKGSVAPGEAKVVADHIDALVHEQTKGLRGAARKQAAGEIYRRIHANSLSPEDPFHVFPAEETAAHLKSKLNPSNAEKGLALSPTRYGTVNGVDNIVVSGTPTVNEWVSRAVAAIPDATDRLKWKNWYREVWPKLQEHFGSDAIWILRGFGASQANASPAMGLTAVLRMMDDLKRGIPLTRDDQMRYSAVAHSIMDAVQGTPVEEGVAKKLSDFIDSAQGRSTRTVMGHDPAGGMPAAVDIHSGRDFGFVDTKLVNRLQSLHGLKPGEDFTVDMGNGVPGTLQYERVAEFYHQVADHLNAMDGGKGFDGMNDWTPSEVQALGWGAIQKTHGADPEDMAFALNRNTSQIALEVLNGTRGLGSGLPFALQQVVTKEVAEKILPRLFAEENVYVQKVEFGAGGWRNEQSPNLVAHIIATPEQVDRVVSRAAQIFDQHDVWGVRVGVQVTKRDPTPWTNTIGMSRRALEIKGGDFSNPAKLREFWTNFRNHLPEKERKNFEGYTTYTEADGRTGIRVIAPIGSASKKSLEAWSARFKDAIAKAARDSGMTDVGYSTTNVEVRDARGAVDRASARRAGDVRRPPGGGGLGAAVGDPLAAEARQVTEESIARHANLGPEARPGLGGVRPAPETGTGAGGIPPEQPLGGQMTLPGVEAQVGPEDAAQVMAQRLHGAEMTRSAQEAGYTVEHAKRFAAADEAYQKAGGGTAGHIAASQEYRGKYPTLNYKGFSEFTPDAVDELTRDIYASPELSTPERKRAADALHAAIDKFAVPQRNQLILLRKVFPEEVVQKVVKASDRHWAWNALELGNLPRALESSLDFSAVFRQGLVAGARHPVLAAKNLKPMVEAAASKARYDGYMHVLATDPVVQDGIDRGLAMTDVGSMSQHEERFASRIFSKIPGLRGSERAYTLFLNKMRADMYRSLYKDALRDVGATKKLTELSGYKGSKVITEKDALESLANYINHATGRGELRHLAGAAEPLNAFFFSPKLLKSRFNLLLNPRWYARQTPYVRRQALRAMFQTVGVGMTVLGAAKLAGADVGINPLSSDFGKIRVGNTRFDIWGGFQPLARYAAQLAAGQYVSPTTGKLMPIGSGKFGATTRGDVLIRFARSKLSPNAGLLADYLFGKSVTGQKFRWRDQWQRLTPLLMQDAADLYKEQGGSLWPPTFDPGAAAKTLGLYGIGATGIGTQTYPPPTPPTHSGGGLDLSGGGASGGLDLSGSGSSGGLDLSAP